MLKIQLRRVIQRQMQLLKQIKKETAWGVVALIIQNGTLEVIGISKFHLNSIMISIKRNKQMDTNKQMNPTFITNSKTKTLVLLWMVLLLPKKLEELYWRKNFMIEDSVLGSKINKTFKIYFQASRVQQSLWTTHPRSNCEELIRKVWFIITQTI